MIITPEQRREIIKRSMEEIAPIETKQEDKLPKKTDGCVHDWHTEGLVLFPCRIKYRCSKCGGYTYSKTVEERKNETNT